MGARNWLHNKRMKDPVDAAYQLTSSSYGDPSSAFCSCRMNGVVTGPGVGPVAVEHECMAPTKKWPAPGQTLPVTVDRADPTRLAVRWDDLPTNRELGREQAQQQAAQLAASMQAGAPAGQQPADKPSVTFRTETHVVGDAGRPVPGATGGGLTPEQTAAALGGGGSGLQQATATVLAVHEVAVPAGLPGGGAAGTVDLTLDVALSTGEGYSSQMRLAFSTADKRAMVAVVGKSLPVLVNPAQHDQILIDTNRLR